MSAHRTLNDMYRAFDAVGPGILDDPGNGGIIRFSSWGQICPITTTQAETATLAQPNRAGIMATVVLDVDGGDLTLTVTGGYNQSGMTTIIFGDAGDFAVFYSVKIGTTYRWQLLQSQGTDAVSDLALFGPTRPRGLNMLGTRYELKWVAGARGKPSLNGDIQNAAEGTRMIADPDFEILGTNASSDDVTYYVEGGVTLQTDGGDNDQVIILPHLDANQTAWAQVTWGTDQETEWECMIRTAASVATQTIWCGLKLTNVSVTATDDDQAFFRYAAATNSGKWQAIGSRAGTDVETDSGVTVAANTDYHLKITIDASRIPRFYINGVLVDTGAALVTAKDLIPYIGIHANHATAFSLHVRGQAISRKVA